MVDPSQIREHLEVVGSDGEHVGRVDHVDEHVHLNLTRDEARARWTGKYPRPGYREFTKAPLLSAGPPPI